MVRSDHSKNLSETGDDNQGPSGPVGTGRGGREVKRSPTLLHSMIKTEVPRGTPSPGRRDFLQGTSCTYEDVCCRPCPEDPRVFGDLFRRGRGTRSCVYVWGRSKDKTECFSSSSSYKSLGEEQKGSPIFRTEVGKNRHTGTRQTRWTDSESNG